MKPLLTAFLLAVLASTAFAAHEVVASSPEMHCLPPTVEQVLSFS
jgi:hypothetical protein